MAPSLLGIVTNFHERQEYIENRVFSKTLNSLCDMHDLLVDAPKQGYIFTGKGFDAIKKYLGLKKNLPAPAYKDAMDSCAP